MKLEQGVGCANLECMALHVTLYVCKLVWHWHMLCVLVFVCSDTAAWFHKIIGSLIIWRIVICTLCLWIFVVFHGLHDDRLNSNSWLGSMSVNICQNRDLTRNISDLTSQWKMKASAICWRSLSAAVPSSDAVWKHGHRFCCSEFAKKLSVKFRLFWCACWIYINIYGDIVGRMSMQWTKNLSHSDHINVWNIAANVVPLCSVFQAPLRKPTFTLLAPVWTKLASLSMPFIPELTCSAVHLKDK